ncbi:response regulator [Solimonas terrae]|uniref:Response regulator n=1 Tax=Solimonas terrae TaxID=1396819 RepID=A0A6M2BMQ6_9GAMM|nr:response regulator [Solimonas terrae]NGY03886.1 response regulator [Solimonas terrae]
MEISHRIVIVEDDREIGPLVRELLVRDGYAAEWARSGSELDAALVRERVDLVVLDLMLPGEDGLSICRRLRAAAANLPIVMLTAKGEDLDRIIGLELGADDYLAKPFNPRELLARIRAVLRRAAPASSLGPAGHERLRFAQYVFDLAARRLTHDDGHEIDLSAGDYDLLAMFVRHPQRVLSREQIMEFTRRRSWEVYDRSIDIAASRLRRKIEADPARPALIKTVRNGGYLFAVGVERLA